MRNVKTKTLRNKGQVSTSHEVHIVNQNIGIWEAENAKFTVCTSRFSPSLIHGLCAILPLFLFHGFCAFSRPLLTPASTAPSLPVSQFTVCTSRFTRSRKGRFSARYSFLMVLWNQSIVRAKSREWPEYSWWT